MKERKKVSYVHFDALVELNMISTKSYNTIQTFSSSSSSSYKLEIYFI